VDFACKNMKDELQVENGHFTRIVNPLIDNLIKVPFKGCELALAMFIIRKTYGYQKKEDQISISQFMKGIGRGRPTVVKGLKNLQLINIAELVKRGDSRNQSNVWKINKYHASWKLVNIAELVKTKRLTGKAVYTTTGKGGLTHKRKKERTKESSDGIPSHDIEVFIKSFETVNPSYEVLFRNTTERAASDRLIKKFGLEKMLKTTEQLPTITSQPYAPRITTPYELERNLGKLIIFVNQQKGITNTKETKIAFT
jgi:phage replication O-like protein O